MTGGKADLLAACRQRRIKTVEESANLLETRVRADGNLDGMAVHIHMNCISGMPRESAGVLTLTGNLAQLLAVLARVWPVQTEAQEVLPAGRRRCPGPRPQRKA